LVAVHGYGPAMLSVAAARRCLLNG
jgi:hypothetical protein